MQRITLILLLAGATLASPARAQTPGPGMHPGGDDPLNRFFCPPELVLQHAQELGLQPAQRTTIVTAVKEAQGDLFDLQLLMSDRGQELTKLLNGTERVDEAAVLAQVDKILAVERDMKRRQLQLLIRVRNALTREQQEQVAQLRQMHEPF